MELHGEYIREWLLLLLLLLLGELHGDCIREWLFMNGQSRLDLDAPGSPRPELLMLFFLLALSRALVFIQVYYSLFQIWINPA